MRSHRCWRLQVLASKSIRNKSYINYSLITALKKKLLESIICLQILYKLEALISYHSLFNCHQINIIILKVKIFQKKVGLSFTIKYQKNCKKYLQNFQKKWSKITDSRIKAPREEIDPRPIPTAASARARSLARPLAWTTDPLREAAVSVLIGVREPLYKRHNSIYWFR